MTHTSVDLPPINALGTTWWLEIFDLVSDDKKKQTHAIAIGYLQQFEQRYSRFLTDSWISRLNAERSYHAPDQEFIDLLTYGLSAYRRTNDAFNLLIGNQLIARGYDAAYSFIPSKEPPPPPDPHDVLTISSTRITLTDKHTIDCGGFGKGYAIDGLAALLQAHGYVYFLINGGGDMYVTSDHEAPITIHLEHPTEPGISLGTVALKNVGFAASSSFKRMWHTKEQTYSHLMTTDQQPSHVASFVIADNARDADVFATTCTVIDEAACLRVLASESIQLARYEPAVRSMWYGRWPH